MKRFIFSAALAVLATVGIVGNAAATGRGGIYLKTEQIGWRFHRAAYSTYGLNDAVGWYQDSVSFNRVGSGGATMSVANAETSTVISTRGWALVQAAPGLLDSSLVARVFVWDAGSSDASIDSLQLKIMVSPDGKNWLYANEITGTAVGVNPITATAPQVASYTLLNLAGTTTSTPKVFSYKWSNSQASGIYPDRFNWWQWPLVRFVLLNKTVGAVQHNFNIAVTHWSTETEN